ncbi:MAG: hypothetical protein PUG67_09250 [Peptoniphilaceae bacterium]|nr:hypothetical protein [Peptoniphilaceae bacterium]MDY6018491.1 hypothetical protein [Anaerococcus sp.]
MKIQIQFKIKDDQSDKELNRSKTFTGIDPQATNENLVKFAKAYMGLTDIKKYSVVKITTENIDALSEE